MKKKINLKKFIGREWIKHWAGHWKLLNNSDLGFQYTKLLKQSLGAGLEVAMFISHKGYTVCYLDLQYYKRFGQHLAERVVTNEKQVDRWSKELRKKTDAILGLIKKLKSKEAVSAVDFKQFEKAFFAYAVPHRVVKVVVDALSAQKLEKFLPKLSKARVYAEPVYAETETFMEFMASQIARKTSYRKEHILYTTREEIEEYWKTGQLPPKKELASRFSSCTIIYDKGNYKLLRGTESDNFEKQIERQSSNTRILTGFTAYPGKVRGRVRIVFDARKINNFITGDILVTGMTRPEYVPLIKKSAGFITDAGGMLSHAAISARELRKPCVVGTRFATKVLKEGQIVEIDAKRGLIRKI